MKVADDTRRALAKLQESRIKTITKMYAAGKTTEDIADYFGLSRQRIHQIYTNAGFKVERRSRYHGRHVK
jgi:DNA-directed RNA polymerase sigma subunit (sigma70/sigma32)